MTICCLMMLAIRKESNFTIEFNKADEGDGGQGGGWPICMTRNMFTEISSQATSTGGKHGANCSVISGSEGAYCRR